MALRARFARGLVCHVSDALDRAYGAWCAKDISTTDFGRVNYRRIERFWAWRYRLRERWAFPIARRLDKEAMATQMVQECWWG